MTLPCEGDHGGQKLSSGCNSVAGTDVDKWPSGESSGYLQKDRHPWQWGGLSLLPDFVTLGLKVSLFYFRFPSPTTILTPLVPTFRKGSGNRPVMGSCYHWALWGCFMEQQLCRDHCHLRTEYPYCDNLGWCFYSWGSFQIICVSETQCEVGRSEPWPSVYSWGKGESEDVDLPKLRYKQEQVNVFLESLLCVGALCI